MGESTTLTVRLSPKIKKQLGRLAENTDRTKSWLAAEAIADYVARESEIAAEIKEALAEVRSGKAKFVPHAEAMARLRTKVGRVSRSKS